MPHLIQRQLALQDEINQLADLITRMKALQAQSRKHEELSAHQLRSDHWYELQLVDEGQLLQNKLEFLQIELRDLTTVINRMRQKNRVVTTKAEEVERQISKERDTRLDAAQSFRRATQQF